MRLSMKSTQNSYTITPRHSSNQQQSNSTCSFAQQVSFTTQHYLSQHSPKKWEQIQQTSPRLADRWMQYMGVEDWAGLLDPLDDNLRGEIVRYGSFAEAAYRAFDFDMSSESYGSCKHPKKSLLQDCGFSGTGYRITCNLKATSGINVPDWASSTWPVIAQSSWIGYVAVCQDKSVIKRLGRRDVVIALRGTATCLEWLENFRTTLTPIPWDCNVSPCDQGDIPMVESGFLSLYTSNSDTHISLQESLRSEINRIIEVYPNEDLSFTFTGHSLGAALATLAAYDIKTTSERAPLVTVMSFGGPRVGNKSFRSIIEKQGTKILRIVNPNDLITKVPGFVLDNNEKLISNSIHDSDNDNNNNVEESSSHPLARLWPRWIQKRVEDTQWVYAEVGHELRLTMPEPGHALYYLNHMNLAKCHDLKTYLKLVSQGVTSNCPVRASIRKKRLSLQNKRKEVQSSYTVA